MTCETANRTVTTLLTKVLNHLRRKQRSLTQLWVAQQGAAKGGKRSQCFVKRLRTATKCEMWRRLAPAGSGAMVGLQQQWRKKNNSAGSTATNMKCGGSWRQPAAAQWWVCSSNGERETTPLAMTATLGMALTSSSAAPCFELPRGLSADRRTFSITPWAFFPSYGRVS